MGNLYSIIIPVHNEINFLPQLLNELKEYVNNGHEIVIVNDGSNDGSTKLLEECDFIKHYLLKKNYGKGIALIEGIRKSFHEKIIIFDGDMELNPSDIQSLMVLNKNIDSVFGFRYETIYPFKSTWDLGNYLITKFFNFIHKSEIKDVLCCAKSFYRNDIDVNKLKSKKFDIDVELASLLLKKNINPKQIRLKYQRRNVKQGKKLGISDSWSILIRILSYR